MWISYILILFSYKTYFFPIQENKRKSKMADYDVISTFKISKHAKVCILYAYMLYIILKRWLYQYYWYFTYLSGKIIRNIEKSEYDVTVTSSLGVASQNWVWGFFVRRWSLCVNFMNLALLVPEIQIDQKSPVWIRLILLY